MISFCEYVIWLILVRTTTRLVMTSVSDNRGENETDNEEKYSRPSTPSDQRVSLLTKADDRDIPLNHIKVTSK